MKTIEDEIIALGGNKSNIGCFSLIIGVILIFIGLVTTGWLILLGVSLIVFGFTFPRGEVREFNGIFEKEVNRIIGLYPFNESYTYVTKYSEKVSGKSIRNYVEESLFYKFSIDTDNKEILLIHIYPDENGLPIHTVTIKDFTDLIEVKVKKNAQTVTSSSRSIGGALVGGVLAGGAGAIIGGTGASTTSTESIKRLSLELVLNDLDKPSLEIVFYQDEIDALSPNDHTKERYGKLTEEVNEWFRRLEVIIHQTK